MAHKKVTLPRVSRAVVLVPRAQLRQTRHGRTLKLPRALKAVAATIPTPPTSWDGSKGRAVKYPMLGNDQVGDCYYADACHCIQTWTGQVGTQAAFDTAAVVARYEAVSGGDNGLGDRQIFAEWQQGIIGPRGVHKILDDMTIDPADDPAIRLGMWLFAGSSWTAALPDAWVASAAPGVVWDAGQPNLDNGHAMHLSGYVPASYACETWGFDPAIILTPPGLRSADPEVTVQFSLEMFDPRTGIAPHNGLGYDQLAALWQALGGQKLPSNPFTGPPPQPLPPPSSGAFQTIPLLVRGLIRKGKPFSFELPEDCPPGTYALSQTGSVTMTEVFPEVTP